MVYEAVVQIPMSTFIVWSLIGIYQIYRGRTRTLTEIGFIFGSLAWAGYALADWLVFHTPATDPAMALVMAKIAVSFVTLAAFFLLLFTKLFLTRPHRTDILLALPCGLALSLVWSGMMTGVKSAPWRWTALFDESLFLVWLLYVVVYASVAIWYIYRTYIVVREESRFLGRRVFGIFTSLLATLALGLGTNTIFHALGIGLMPLFSSMLLLPGIITLYVLVPLSKERISGVMRKWKSRMYQVLGVYLIYENGTLIASKTSIEDRTVDEDIFSATLDAIQTFMRTSFPLLLGKWLRRIEHGDVRILIERGKKSYLAVIIQGEDTDTLWIKMKESVERFERMNELELMDWSGAADDLNQVSETLDDLVEERAVFA